MFIHLSTHSAYSLQEGLSLPDELARAAANEGMPAIGLTDHRLLTGVVEFVTACKKEGVQPLIGLEVDLPTNPLALLAMDMEGWANLCRLSSALALRENPEAPCPLELLSTYSAGLIALSHERGNEGIQKLGRLKETFAGRLYISLQDPATALKLVTLARKLGLPSVVTHPVYYLKPEQKELQQTAAAIRLNQGRERLPEGAAAPEGAYFTSAEKMERRFEHFPVALEATQEIAERCRFELPLGTAHMPTVPLPPGMTAAQTLRSKAEAGARQLYGAINPLARARLDHELDVIAKMGYEPIFLIVEEILEFARRTGVPYSSRGSAASSLVAHCLGITSPDPLRLDLYFERFLNPARKTPPDIDTDLCSRRREKVIRHVFEAFGEEKVAMVGTINRYRPRSALGDTAKAHGMAPQMVREMVERLPYGFWWRIEQAEGKEPVSPFEGLRKAYPNPQFGRIFDEAEALLKLPRHLSVHAGGVVVGPGKLTELVPVMRSGAKGVTITQFDLGAVEAFGLVKIDLLGIRGLTVQGDVAEFIQAGQPGEYATPLAVLDSTPAEDPETSQRVESGGTIGCFQIESPGMRATLKEIHARTPDDIMAALALYRPGPLSGGLKDAFVRRFRGEEAVEHIHPALSSLLAETFGVILYQEQVLRIAHELAGFSLAEADLLRRAMSHFDPGKQMQMLQQKFVAEAERLNRVPRMTGEKIWEMMAAFAGYGFPKAHAASYAQVSWRSAWCKTHFPGEFMAAVLANWGGYYSQRVYLSEARRLGLKVRPPHVNFSGRNFVYTDEGLHTQPRSQERNEAAAGLNEQKALFMGLDQVRDMTGRTIERILRGRPFQGLEDFLARADPRPQEARDLAQAGALEGFGNIPTLLNRLEGGWQQHAGGTADPLQPALFEYLPEGKKPVNEKLPEEPDWTLGQKLKAQEELLGIWVSAHPLELVEAQVKKAGAITTVEAAGKVGQRVTVAGLRQAGHRSRTGKGEMMMFMTLEDLAGMLDVVFFPQAYKRSEYALNSSAPLLVTGMVEWDDSRGEPILQAERGERIR
jgi:DNA polymerase III subunit alpha